MNRWRIINLWCFFLLNKKLNLDTFLCYFKCLTSLSLTSVLMEVHSNKRANEREWERLLAMSGARKYCSPNYIENPDRIKLKHANNFIIHFMLRSRDSTLKAISRNCRRNFHEKFKFNQ